MRFGAVGFGDTAEEAIKEWKDRVTKAWDNQGGAGLKKVKTWQEDKTLPKPKRLYGRRWEIIYEEDLG